jgi:hypothetical protein
MNVKEIQASVVGVALSGASGFFLYAEMTSPPAHSGHIYLFAGGIFLGALVMAPALIISPLKQLSDVVGPYLPWGKKDAAP